MPAMNHIDGIAKLVTSLAVMIAAVAELVAAIAKYKAKKEVALQPETAESVAPTDVGWDTDSTLSGVAPGDVAASPVPTSVVFFWF